MDDKTTTDAATQEPGVATATQPEEQPAEAAKTVDSEPKQATKEPAPAPADDDNSEWLKSKGIDLSTEEGQTKLAKSYRELEKSYHQKSAKAAELEKSVVTGFDEAVQQDVDSGALEADDPRIAIRKLEIKQNVRDFFDDNPEAKQLEPQMTELVAKRPHLANDLEALYALAKVSATDVNKELKTEGAQEALQTLANKQRAAVPTGAAVNPVGGGSQTITPENVDKLVGENDVNWFMKNQKAINEAMAGR